MCGTGAAYSAVYNGDQMMDLKTHKKIQQLLFAEKGTDRVGKALLG